MAWIAFVLALTGAFLVTKEDRRLHFAGFVMWSFTNAYWAIYNWGDWALCAQFSAFFILALLGIKNTLKAFKKS